MRDWLKRLRGLMGLGVLGGAAGALFGVLWWLLAPIIGVFGVVMGDIWITAVLWGFFGAFAASGAGLLLTFLASRQTLEELSPWRVAAFGAVAGFLAPVAFLFMVAGSFWGPYMNVFATVSGLAGGLLGGGLVVAAKRAPAERLTSAEHSTLGPGEPVEG